MHTLLQKFTRHIIWHQEYHWNLHLRFFPLSFQNYCVTWHMCVNYDGGYDAQISQGIVYQSLLPTLEYHCMHQFWHDFWEVRFTRSQLLGSFALCYLPEESILNWTQNPDCARSKPLDLPKYSKLHIRMHDVTQKAHVHNEREWHYTGHK
jgi:hypothetical protein